MSNYMDGPVRSLTGFFHLPHICGIGNILFGTLRARPYEIGAPSFIGLARTTHLYAQVYAGMFLANDTTWEVGLFFHTCLPDLVLAKSSDAHINAI